MTDELFLDFESYSACNLKTRGGMNYAKHPSTNVICLGYAFNDEPAQVWTPAEDISLDILDHVSSGYPVYAHNAGFDYRIWNECLVSSFGYPALSLEQMVDSASLCMTYGIPAALDKAGKALGIRQKKLESGLALIKACCVPEKNGQQPSPFGPKRDKFRELFMYCRRDVEAMREIVNKLPRRVLLPKEQRLWELTYEMNTTGLPIDHEAVVSIRDYLKAYVFEALKDVPKKSGGAFKTLGQLEKMKVWCGLNGYPMKKFDAVHVQAGLDDPDCPDNVKEILEMRKELGRSSTAKFTKLAELAGKRGDNFWVYDNVQFHGAGPGRWAGRGFQVHNLPRAAVDDPEACIQEFLEGVI